MNQGFVCCGEGTPDADADGDCNCNTNGDSNSNSVIDCYADRNTHFDAHTSSDTYGNYDPDAYCYCYSNCN